MSFTDSIASLIGHKCAGMSVYDAKVIQFALTETKFGQAMFVGDSITQGWSGNGFLDDKPITNYGIAGDVSLGVIKRLNQIKNAKPSAVFLNIGINDINSGQGQFLMGRYITILEALTPICDVYCCAIRPVNNYMSLGNYTTNSIIHTVNTKIHGYGLSVSSRCKFIPETNSCHISPTTGQMLIAHTTDGLHMSKLGYEEEYKVLLPYLQKYL